MFRFVQIILSIPKTVLFNFMVLKPMQAIKLPFFIHYSTRIRRVHRNIVELPDNIHFFMIKIGWGGSNGVYSHSYSELIFEKGKIVFKGNAFFAAGTSIRSSGYLEFGKHFNSNKNLFISCSQHIVFGDDVLIGWNVSIRDSDGHTVILNSIPKESKSNVCIGNHVWICSETHILKGVSIGPDSVVAYGSLLTRKIEGNGLLIGGCPAIIIQEGIDWKM